jgi:hypothetical protein
MIVSGGENLFPNDVIEHEQAQDALHAHSRHPGVFPRIPGCLGELVIREAPAALQQATR